MKEPEKTKVAISIGDSVETIDRVNDERKAQHFCPVCDEYTFIQIVGRCFTCQVCGWSTCEL